MIEDKGIYKPLQQMFKEARTDGLWFFQPYQRLWFSPDELEKANRKGQFRWGPVNWTLRDPQERVTELVKKHQEIHKEIESIRQRM